MKTAIMYVEGEGNPKFAGRICRVRLSKTGKTLFYNDYEFIRIRGYKANHLEINSNCEYWISNPKKLGEDTLYPGVVYVDEDVREEYWVKIRNMPENAKQVAYKCDGKYSGRQPHAELNVNGNTRNGGDRAQQK